jgi:hypothetical protein
MHLKSLFIATVALVLAPHQPLYKAEAQSLPPGMSLTCQFTSGPRAGQTQNFTGVPGATPTPIGSPCTDGQGSLGVAVSSTPSPSPRTPSTPPGMSLTCQFTSGPRTGQTQNFSGMPGATPAPIGSPCTDGQGSFGVAIGASPTTSGPPPGGPAGISTTCRFTNGPRLGQTQNFAGFPGVTPIPVGSPCTDGAGSTGFAIADTTPSSGPSATNPPSTTAPTSLPPGMSLTCSFTNGPRAGQVQNFAGVPGVTPIPVGSPCNDGLGSFGIAQ